MNEWYSYYCNYCGDFDYLGDNHCPICGREMIKIKIPDIDKPKEQKDIPTWGIENPWKMKKNVQD